MDCRKLLDILHLAEKLKDTTRHCYTSSDRHESVAEHCWRSALMAYLLKDEFPEADISKVILMCLIHDLGECFTGDIPTFNKTKKDEETEERLLRNWLSQLPLPYSAEMLSLFNEMAERATSEARLFKAIDNLEAVIQHNESKITTWLPNEYELNLVYGNDNVEFSSYLKLLRKEIKEDTLKKIKEER